MASRNLLQIGKSLDKLNNLIQTKHPESKWIIEEILPIFNELINSNTTSEQEGKIIGLLNNVFDAYEFRFNEILENKT